MAFAYAAYVTASNYRDTNGAVSSDFDTQRGALAVTVSKIIDGREGVSPGHFGPQTDVAYTFRCTVGGSRLYLRDEKGWQCLLRTATAIGVDTENDSTFDGATLTLGTTVYAGPMNAPTYGEPYEYLEMRDGSSFTVGRLYRITGNWGFAVVPGGIAERVTRCMRELVEVGFGGPHADMDAAAAALDGNRSTVALLERRYSYALPVFA